MRLPRFRVRTLMIAVAVVAIIAWSLSLRAEVERRRARAADHSRWERFARHAAAGFRSQDLAVGRFRLTRKEADRLADELERWIFYRAAMRQKWERAARYPWLPVAPDPPPPK